MTERTDEERWRTGGEGRLDLDGVRWWACDPYPTWYRWEDGTLYAANPPPSEHAEHQRPRWSDDDD